MGQLGLMFIKLELYSTDVELIIENLARTARNLDKSKHAELIGTVERIKNALGYQLYRQLESK